MPGMFPRDSRLSGCNYLGTTLLRLTLLYCGSAQDKTVSILNLWFSPHFEEDFPWMETGCYSPLENKMRCQLNCRPSVSQIFKGRKEQRLRKAAHRDGRAARWWARCSRRSEAQEASSYSTEAPGWLRTTLQRRPRFQPEQGDRQQVAGWPDTTHSTPTLGGWLTMQPADSKTLPSWLWSAP